ncbi:hypothetical protein KXR53_01035 [Inquilinus limosus]|uniref:hypothetical protein n=1 Tax=Inquilinus limosus TaxID=171674 RepID=UPI003F18D69E
MAVSGRFRDRAVAVTPDVAASPLAAGHKAAAPIGGGRVSPLQVELVMPCASPFGAVPAAGNEQTRDAQQ